MPDKRTVTIKLEIDGVASGIPISAFTAACEFAAAVFGLPVKRIAINAGSNHHDGFRFSVIESKGATDEQG